MGFKKGNPGRPPGAKNKKTDLFAICEKHGVNLFEEAIMAIANEPDSDERFNKTVQILPYLYAKKKEVVNLDQHPVEDLLKAAEDMLKDEPK